MATLITCDRCHRGIEEAEARWSVSAGRYEVPPPVDPDAPPAPPPDASALPASTASTAGLMPTEGVHLDLHVACWEQMAAEQAPEPPDVAAPHG